MPDPSNSSFIPKHGASRRKRVAGKRPVYIFTIISYVLIFSTLLAAAGVYFYNRIVDQEFDTAVQNLNVRIQDFSDADMQKVQDFDLRLVQASGRLNASVSIVSLFDALEASTIDTVQILSLKMEREGDEKFTLDAEVVTDSFDSTIFQRGVYSRNKTIGSVDISSINSANSSSTQLGVSSAPETISFKAEMEVMLNDIPYEPSYLPSQPDFLNAYNVESFDSVMGSSSEDNNNII